jgi:large subunit ribosomal protein L4e
MLKKTKEAVNAFEAIGLGDELKRAAQKKIRAGRGKSRGRKYDNPTGPLVVVSKACDMAKAAKGIPGVTVKVVNELSAEELAPGCTPGRMTFFTKAALEILKEGKLYN